MKAFLAALTLIGFVGLNSFAQEGTEAPAPGASTENAGDRTPAKAKHKKGAKKKKHSKKHKGNM